MCVLPGLVGLDLGVGAGLDGDGEEVVGVVSCEMENILFFLFCRCEFFGHVQRFRSYSFNHLFWSSDYSSLISVIVQLK